MGLSRTTTFAEIVSAAVTSQLADTYHALPGIVQAYYAATMEADIQIAVNDPRFDPDSDTLTTEPWPVYPKVRVAFPRGSGFTICWPLAVGDKVQVFFQDLDDSSFRSTGQQGDPPRTRRHASDAAFALPWDLTDGGVVTDANTGGMVIGLDGTSAEIRISAGRISLGATGAHSVTRDDLLQGELTKIKNTLGSLTGATFSIPYPTVGPTASTLVKCD